MKVERSEGEVAEDAISDLRFERSEEEEAEDAISELRFERSEGEVGAEGVTVSGGRGGRPRASRSLRSQTLRSSSSKGFGCRARCLAMDMPRRLDFLLLRWDMGEAPLVKLHTMCGLYLGLRGTQREALFVR